MASKTSTSKKSYDAAFKLKVINFAEGDSNRGAGRKFNINEKQVREWRKQKDNLKDISQDKQRITRSIHASPSSVPGTRKRSYDAAFKLKVVEFAEGNTNRGAGRKFEVDEKMVRVWRKQKEQLETVPPDKLRLGCHPLLPDLEATLAAWVKEHQAKNIRITRAAIQAKALELHSGPVEFKASLGWLDKFFHRHDLSLKRTITIENGEPMSSSLSLDNAEIPSTAPGTRKRSYDAAFKLKVVEFAEGNTNRGAGRKFEVDEKMVRVWRKQKEQLKMLPPDKLRLTQRCHPLLPDLEASLAAWVKEQQAENNKLTGISIQAKALALYNGPLEFKASRGWLERFLQRHRLSCQGTKTNGSDDSMVCSSSLSEVVEDPVSLIGVEEAESVRSEVDIEACLDMDRTL